MQIIIKTKQFAWKILLFVYKQSMSFKIRKLRKKSVISVLFILNDISKWKTEELYLKMLAHPRFKPMLGVTFRLGESPSAISRNVLNAISYLQNRNYKYTELTHTITPNPDIVIYTEPYGDAVPRNQSILAYFSSLFISINYSCHTTHLSIDYYSMLHKFAWIDCYESVLAINDAYKHIGHKRKSLRHTGLPVIDELIAPAGGNPWKAQKKDKKRIIWAPHHSIGGFDNETIVYGNFLDMYELMFVIADKYSNYIQIAFKPHPLLREKLERIWGVKKTMNYYEKWDTLENGQLEESTYTDLFKYSDALIHDSSSFIVEYQVLNKPVLFIVRNETEIIKDLNSFGKRAFYAQQLTTNVADVDLFVREVISDVDRRAEERNKFISEILSPNGTPASENIINCIINS